VCSKNPFDKYDRSRPIIVPFPSDDEISEWFVELAGNSPARQAAVERWSRIKRYNIGLQANYNENRFEALCFTDTDVAPNHLVDLNLFPEIQLLILQRAKFSDEALDVLSKQSHLRWIDAEDGPDLDNRFCRAIAKLPKLEYLRLINTQIDDAGGEYLSRLDKLIGITLNGSKVSSFTLRRFSRLTNLTDLQIADSRVDDDGLQQIDKLSKLIWLNLDNTKVTDAGIERLRPLKSLCVLLLANTAVTDRSVKVFVGFEAPCRINLEGTKITNEAVRLLSPLPKLGDANFAHTSIDDECVPYIEKMQSLHSLDLRGTKISRQGIERIAAVLPPTTIFLNDFGVRARTR
jgi:hypothetical protein